jgi:hypothetical protein
MNKAEAIERLTDEVLTVAGQSGPYTEFDLQQPDFAKRAAVDFLADLRQALDNLKDESS